MQKKHTIERSGEGVKRMSLSEQEKETVIQFDESTNLATVYTASWTVARNLKKAGYQPIRKKDGAWWFHIPVDTMSIAGTKQTTTIC
jgi:hypothetical protein